MSHQCSMVCVVVGYASICTGPSNTNTSHKPDCGLCHHSRIVLVVCHELDQVTTLAGLCTVARPALRNVTSPLSVMSVDRLCASVGEATCCVS